MLVRAVAQCFQRRDTPFVLIPSAFWPIIQTDTKQLNKSTSPQGGGGGRDYLVFVTVSGSVSILLPALVIHVERDSRHLSRQLHWFDIGLSPQTLACFRAKENRTSAG